MKYFILFWLGMFGMAGFSQSLPFHDVGTILNGTNLIIHWQTAKHPWPKKLWLYDMTRSVPSSVVISNLMAIGGFSEKDIDRTGNNGMSFAKDGRTMSISYTLGVKDYFVPLNYGPTNLTHNVPGTNQLFALAINLLPKIGIGLSNVLSDKHGKPIFTYPISYSEYYFNHQTITNIESRRVDFSRVLDGIRFTGTDDGYGSVAFGESNRVVGISTYWADVKRKKLYAAATPDQIIRWIREGRAYYIAQDDSLIDWSTVKSLTIKKATAYYVGENFTGKRLLRPVLPSLVSPFAELQAVIKRNSTDLTIIICCPIINENNF